MFWELIAVAFAGLSGAGIAMGLRFLVKRLPKWLIPALAGLCMLGFSIYSEYSWYAHTASRLPEGSVVISEVPHTAFYKPWSYVKPQVLQFVVLDKNSVKSIDDNQKQILLYFFERRHKAQTLPAIIDCQMGKHKLAGSDWHKNELTPSLLVNACTP